MFAVAMLLPVAPLAQAAAPVLDVSSSHPWLPKG